MTNILNRGFSRYPDDALMSKVMVIIAALTGNASFPTTNPTLAVLQAALDALTQAMAIQGPAREPTVAARGALEQKLEDLADDLERTANNDPVKLATTGFDLRKETAQTGAPPDVPVNVRVKTTGVSGEVQVLFDPSDREICVDGEVCPGVNWAHVGTS